MSHRKPNWPIAASFGSYSCDACDETVKGQELHFDAAVLSGEGRPGVGGRHQQCCLGIGAGEDQQVRRIEITSGPFTFDGRRAFPARRPDQVHFVTLFVPPVTQVGGLKMRGEFVEDVVFPEVAQVVGPQAGPAAMGTDEASVETIDFGGGDDFVAAAGTERSEHQGHGGSFEDGEIVRDGGAADFARRGESGRLKNAAALGQEKFYESLEGSAALEAEEFLDVLGPVGIHPFLEIALGRFRRQEEGREAAMQQAMQEVGVAKVGQIRLDHRGEPQFRLAPGERVAKAAARAERRGAGGQDADGGKVVGGDLEQF